MYDPTNTIRRLAAALFATAAMVIAVPVAQGFDGPPDAIDRYNAPASTWDGPPDAIDRYRANQEAAVLAVTRPGFDGPPDAIDRYLGRTATAAPSGRRGGMGSSGASSASAQARCSASCCS